MTVLYVIGTVVGILVGLLSIYTFIEQRRLKRRIERAAKCNFCGVSNADKEGARQQCPRNPDGIGHVWNLTFTAKL